ncbi:MAG: DUF1631 family protein [Gammaproteobacteria bacterium]
MSKSKASRLTSVPSPESGKIPGVIDLSEHPELLIQLQEIKNKARLTPHDFDKVFAELDVRISELGLSQFEQEIDLLSMLFHLAFIDQEVPDEIKTQLARLQINMLISILQESGFIDHSSNPIRRLLETVVKTEVDLKKSGNRDRSGVEILQQGINKIANCEVVVFAAYQELLDQYQEGTVTPADSETVKQQPDKAAEVTKTTQIVLSMMQEFTIPLQVQNRSTILFDKVWSPLMLQVALTDGLKSSSWIKLVQTVKTQVWALTPKTVECDYQTLQTMIPHVSKSLVRSMDSLKLSAKLQKSLIEYLELEQAEVIRNSEINIKALEQKPKPEIQAKKAEASVNQINDEAADSSMPTKTSVSPANDEDQEIKDADPVVPQDAETTVSEAGKLKLGDWIEIKEDDSEILAKLSWRAEDSSLFIFVDREGNRVREVDGVTLDYEIAAGQITVVTTESKSPQKKSILSFFNTI